MCGRGVPGGARGGVQLAEVIDRFHDFLLPSCCPLHALPWSAGFGNSLGWSGVGVQLRFEPSKNCAKANYFPLLLFLAPLPSPARPFPESYRMALRQFYGCLADGVDYLHQKKIRHRDLKLENVLVKHSKVYIADFGTAMGWTASNRGSTQTRGVPEMPHYMAPEDHLKKKADRARTEPWPCRNLSAVHEWMSTLATTQRHEWTDDESLAWRDNEPLTWIKALLEPNQEARLGSRALVSAIVDSMYFRSFACPDCAEDFMDLHCRYGDGHDWPEN
ncbi:hypothetical protein CERZMDRAFT_80751 [Cercospora zeae-maydis SCOH1-5]|uniref:Protein kinase domain-containing protein n=1 Tax=Cercospora zeae-maydis SCOH1-5 TaxID=717836 RepID=A0A6A6FTU8_9PEZI|nr:hypothetical protein CERZMDRAFT_80751 [Cercospora zeae-maydis SCOH1-5]